MYCYVIEDNKTKSGYRLIKDYDNNIIILKGYHPFDYTCIIEGRMDENRYSHFPVIVYQEDGQTKIEKVTKIFTDENEACEYIHKHRKDRKVEE